MIRRYVFAQWTLVAMAALAIVVIVFPWTVAGPSVYRGFDSKLLYVDAAGNARADFNSGGAVLTTPLDSHVTLHAVTSVDDFSAALTATVQQDASASRGLPLGIRLWFGQVGTSYYGPSINLRFLPGPDREIVGSIFDGNKERLVTALGPYVTGQTYRIFVDWHKGTAGSFRIVNPDGTTSRYAVDRSSGLALFDGRYVNLSFDSVASDGNQRVVLSDFSLAIPSQTTFATKASDPRLVVVAGLIAGWSLAFAAYQLMTRRHRSPFAPGTKVEEAPRANWFARPRTYGFVMLGILGLGVLYGLVAPIDGHPYDRLAQESFIYVSQGYGLGALYDRTSVVPDAAVRGGHASWSTLSFAYPPAIAYGYWLIGQAWHLLGGAISPLHDRPFQVFWKLAFALFVPVNAGILYYLAKIARGPRWALIGVAIYVLNPAIIFDAAVWGETEAIVTGALLISVVGFLTGKSRLGWSALVVAILLKQTALFALPVMAIYSLKKYGWGQTIVSGASGLLVGFCVCTPFILLGYHPATIYKSIFAQVLNFANPNPLNASADTFSVWTVVNGFRGLHGFSRIWAPYSLQIGGLGFSTLGTIAFLAVMLFVLWALWRSRSEHLSTEILFLALSSVLVAYVALSTVASARYLLLALPFIALSLAHSSSRTRVWMIGGLTVICFLSMYGLMMEIAARGDWPSYFGLGNASTNALSNVMYQLYTSDAVITTLGLLLFVLAEELLVKLYAASSRSRALPRSGLVVGDSPC